MRVQRFLLAVAALAAAAALAIANAAAAPAARSSLPARLSAALAQSGVPASATGAMVVELTTGRVVFAQNPWLPLVPASNEKLPVGYGALAALGPEFRIETTVGGVGRQVGSTWRGDLYLRGRGDPTLGYDDLAALAAQLRRAGVSRVSGAVVADETFFDARRGAPGWKPQFLGNESPLLSALSVARSAAAQPAAAAAVAFRDALRASGVAARRVRVGPAPPQALPLVSVFSPPLDELVRTMERESDNYYAELLLKQLGARLAGNGTTAAGASALRRVLAESGVPVRGVRIVDGSGLSRLDRLTAGAIVALLRIAWSRPELRADFVGALSVAGVVGTLDGRMESGPARGNVFAKTGTTNLASALSGYVRDRYAFAILQNGNPVPHWSTRRAQDRFATILASQ